MTVRLAMYKGKGGPFNALVRWWTGSDYSHCELEVGGVCYSSSLMDGGVRGKIIDLGSGNWDLVDLAWADADLILAHFHRTAHIRYGLTSLIVNQLLNRNRPDEGAQFCSEWCAAALGLPAPSSLSPATLSAWCMHVTSIYA